MKLGSEVDTDPHKTDWELTFGGTVPGGRKRGARFVVAWRGTAVMGVVNVTPDSFSDGGRHLDSAAAEAAARTMVGRGAFFLDIGGESSRPGARPVQSTIECDRVLPVIRRLRGIGALISIDTTKPEVAKAALDAGAHLINDIGGLRDPDMLAVAIEAKVPVVIMHMLGNPQTMQQRPHYFDVAAEVFAHLRERAGYALEAGVPSVMLDPGIGFGKTVEHNVELLRRLPELVALGYPVLVGASRKSFVGTLTGEVEAERRQGGSLAAHLFAAHRGAAAVRVHDVGLHVQGLAMWRALGDD